VSLSILSALRVVRDAAASCDPRLLSGDECAQLVAALAGVENVCAGLRARAAVRAAECGAHRFAGFSEATDWLARTAGTSRGAARDALATASGLDSCPPVADAIAAGELSLAQANEIVTADHAQPGIAAALIDVARRESMATLRERARAIRLGAVDVDELHRRQHEAMAANDWTDTQGMVHIHATLPPRDRHPHRPPPQRGNRPPVPPRPP